ncbi:MAG: hypothetical protein AAGD28_29665, partial [Bacteroidota bacterium]
MSGDSLLPGQIVDVELAPFVEISSPDSDHPPIIFDSANPTGGDTDLGTPNQSFGGPGEGAEGAISNDQAQNNVLIIAENTIDSNSDGRIDEPDDNRDGGSISFDFAAPVTVLSLKVVDQNPGESFTVDVYDADDRLIESIDSISAGSNSVQTLPVEVANVAVMELTTNGSIAIDDVVLSVPTSAQEAIQPANLMALQADNLNLNIEEALSVVEDVNVGSSFISNAVPQSIMASSSDVQISLFDSATNTLIETIHQSRAHPES